uniref:BT4734/BF3469 family protein n=1 Tax=Alistipes sp. TaxID=1872444 RepID=UPI004055FDDA
AEKQHMPCYSVAVLFSGGKQQKHIVSYTGMSIVDLDHVPSERIAEVLTMVRNDPHTLLAYTTISGEGVRVLARYALNDDDDENENLRAALRTPPSQSDTPSINRGGVSSTPTHPADEHQQNPPLFIEGVPVGRGRSKHSAEQYKFAFLTVNEYYQRLTGCDYDEKCKNATRLSGMAHDPEVYYNPDATAIIVDMTKKSAGRPRKGAKIERVEESVIRELEQRGVVYAPGSHNKYISDACYMMNRYGVSLGDCTAWALDRFNDYQQQGNDVASIVRSCYLQTEEHGTARPPKAEKESRYASIKDIQDWLRGNDIRIRHNVITRKREIEGKPLPPPSPEGRELTGIADSESPLFGRGLGEATELTDQHVNSLYCRFCLDTGRQAKISDFYIIIESDFYPEYHPLKEYLESLPEWNGIDYIDQVASMVHVAGCSQEMHNRFFKQWLVAMVAAWLEPDKTNHEILTYIGPQGIYKSTFVRHLLPTELSGYFSTKNFAGRMSKDDRLELTEMALISLEELDSLQPSELNQLKAITTDPMVNERAAYSRYKERRAHIASFCGTGNNPRFLTDLTDNRRWLPFLVRDIDSPWTHPMPYAGMYSQAYTLYRTGFRYWFDADDNAELQRHNRQFEEPCMEEELIATYLRVPYGDEVGEFLTATRIIELIGGAVKRPLSSKKVALCMN